LTAVKDPVTPITNSTSSKETDTQISKLNPKKEQCEDEVKTISTTHKRKPNSESIIRNQEESVNHIIIGSKWKLYFKMKENQE
jgi:hypothetical protein